MDNKDYLEHPICDTDIWVNLCLGDSLKEFFNLHPIIFIADVVGNEIMKWKNSGNAAIAEEFIKYRDNKNVVVIYYNKDILSEDRPILEQQLREIGFSAGFSKPDKNKGEFVSAIYADYLAIPYMKTNDNAFQEGGFGAKKFPDLEIRNWNDTLRNVIVDDKKRLQISKKVEQERSLMDRRNEKHKEQELEEKINQLKQKFSRR
ncbi:hypothetical protein [Pelosinus sp. IPA-1]|uniref:hypothetical protein n=1 Tax=Pelosinus sp. IPA-1 TaxID=3029569 RepID=UPI00243615D4|nr:hypothetical protein [Pelosinus sp. IPA-1]GMB00094.1 hypothetical protein PIPA1_28930 [Pelosinus sp. IPA-1]